MSGRSTNGKWIAGVIIVAAAIVASVYLTRHQPQKAGQTPVAASSATAAPVVQHPISQARSGPAAATTAPLPPLDASDESVTAALAALSGDGLQGLLLDTHVIERIVATVDALPRHELGRNILPMRTPKGSFVTTDAAGQTMIAEANYARYAPYMGVVENVDIAALVSWYVHAYPLFQQAYRNLGYPDGYFNDRLVVAIDDLLAAPDLKDPVALRQESGHYVYVDSALESLSTGQRMLIRSGPANEAKLKAKLRAIRAELTGVTLPATPASASAAPAGSAEGAVQ